MLENNDLFSQSQSAPTRGNHALDALAHDLFDRCLHNDWPHVLSLARKLTHLSLGSGYYALAGTLKKLYWSLMPHLNESRARKYVFRILWYLARARRENDNRFLIHRNPNRFKLHKTGETVTHLVKLHNFDPDLILPARHEWETMIPHIAPWSESPDKEPQDFRPCQENHHAVMQSPHFMFTKAANFETSEPQS